MTDRDKLINLLLEFGVEFKVHDSDNDIICKEGDKKISGYPSFYTLFEFDENGRFIAIGAWE